MRWAALFVVTLLTFIIWYLERKGAVIVLLSLYALGTIALSALGVLLVGICCASMGLVSLSRAGLLKLNGALRKNFGRKSRIG